MLQLRRFICSALLICALHLQSYGSEDSVDKPNVLLIVIDDLNDYVSALNGHPQAVTPHIDQLAQSGVVFTNAHSNCPLSSPSRASLFTGIYPHHSRKMINESHWYDNPVLRNSKTLMEYFGENGYYVTGTGKLLHRNKGFLWDEWGVDVNNYGPFAYNGHETVGHHSVPQPFRSIGAVDGAFAPLSDRPVFPDSISQGRKTGWIYSTWGGPARKEGEFLEYTSAKERDLLPDEMHARWAMEKIQSMDKNPDDQPFFMAVGFVRPHTPLYAPEKYFEMFPLEGIQLPVIRADDHRDTWYDLVYATSGEHVNQYRDPDVRIPNIKKGPLYHRTLEASYPDIETGLKHFLQAYLACVAFMDDQVGMVLDALNESRFNDNTVVVLASDHGWNMGEKEYLFKNAPWEESTRVPLIVRAPGYSDPGSSVGHPVSLVDIYPTLTDLCQLTGSTIKNENGMPPDGYSLKPFLTRPDYEKWKGPSGALTAIEGGEDTVDMADQTYAWRTRKWRYIRYSDGSEELYNHQGDPYEWQNLAGDKRFYEIKRQLKEEMMEVLED